MILVAAAVVILWIVAAVVWVADASTARQAIDSILLNDGYDADSCDRPEGSSRRVEDAVSSPETIPSAPLG